jgi:hypothetical protein
VAEAVQAFNGRSALAGAAILMAGCQQAAVPQNEAQAAPAPSAPIATAQRLVRQNSGAGEIQFGEARIYSHEGVAIVCGRYSRQGAANQRYVAVSDLQVWLEPDMAPGEMDRAFSQYCRDGAANA